MDIGSIIRRELAVRDMSQRDLARKIGVTEVTMSRYINGNRSPKASTLEKIAKGIGVSVSVFYINESSNDIAYNFLLDAIKLNAVCLTDEQRYRLIKELTKY